MVVIIKNTGNERNKGEEEASTKKKGKGKYLQFILPPLL